MSQVVVQNQFHLMRVVYNVQKRGAALAGSIVKTICYSSDTDITIFFRKTGTLFLDL